MQLHKSLSYNYLLLLHLPISSFLFYVITYLTCINSKNCNLNRFYLRVLDFMISDISDMRMRHYSLLIPITSINSCVLLLLLLLILLPCSYISNICYKKIYSNDATWNLPLSLSLSLSTSLNTKVRMEKYDFSCLKMIPRLFLGLVLANLRNFSYYNRCLNLALFVFVYHFFWLYLHSCFVRK